MKSENNNKPHESSMPQDISEESKAAEINDSELYGACLSEYIDDMLWDKDMKKKDLAARAGVTTRTISRVLHCKCEPCRDTLMKIFAALGVSYLEATQSIHERMAKKIKLHNSRS